LAMALPSRSYSARSSPLLPSVGGRHTCIHIPSARTQVS
jgi:hypothetical protein